MARLNTLRGMAVAALVVTVVLGTISNLLFWPRSSSGSTWWPIPPRRSPSGGPRPDSFAGPPSPTCSATTCRRPWSPWRCGRRCAPWARVWPTAGATLATLGYVLAGSAAAAALAVAGSLLLDPQALPGRGRGAAAVEFAVLIEIVFRGIWQLLDAVLLGVWWLGTGALMRATQPGFARLSLTLGVIALLGAALTALGADVVRDVLLGLVFLLWLVWSIWLALLLNRRAAPFQRLA